MMSRIKFEPNSGSGGDHLVEHMSSSTRICFVCGAVGAIYPLHSRPRERGSYFPFLEQHEIPHGANRPDADGIVLSCTLCYTFLSQQWESYERSRTPHPQRLYWLKRIDNGHYIGAEMRLQGEYASQMIGMSPEPSSRAPGRQHGHCFPLANPPAEITARQLTPNNRLSSYSNSIGVPTPTMSNNQEFYRDTRDNRPNSGSLVQPTSNHVNENVSDASLLLDLRSGSSNSSTSGKDFKSIIKSHDGRSSDPSQPVIKSEASKYTDGPTGNGALDLSMPDKNAITEVCYMCGEEVLKGTLVSVYAKPISNCPFFPSLLSHSRPSKSYPMDHSGCVQTCGPCHQYLLQQWDTFQRQNVPHGERQYRLRKHSNQQYSPRMSQRSMSSASQSPHTPSPLQPQHHPVHSSHSNNFICFLCGQDFAWNQRRILYSGPNSEGEPPLHFLERVKPSRGALPLSATGEALTCSSCYKAAHKQRHAYVDSLRNSVASEEQQNRTHHLHQPHIGNHRSHEGEKYASNKHSREDSNHKILCQMCRQLVSKRYIKFVRNLSDGNKPTYSSLVQNEEENFPVCGTCYNSLVVRWESLEDSRNTGITKQYAGTTENAGRKLVPSVANSNEFQRNGGVGHVNIDMALRIKVPTPDHDIIRSHQNLHSGNATLLTTISNQTSSPVNLAYNNFTQGNVVTTTFATTSTLNSNALDLSGPSRSAMVPLDSSVSKKSRKNSHRPNNFFVCYVCGIQIKNGRSYTVRSYPLKSKENLEAPLTPFFPFLTMHPAPPDAEPEAEDGTVITCTFCFHSLMDQWNNYESTAARHPHDVNRWSRQFNCHDYVCYVCGVTTYRKRVESIRVLDFTFLLDHPRPLASLVMDGGESVVVCLLCYDTLTSQWRDFERMKVPIELRKYNWITSTPPPQLPEAENISNRQQIANGTNVRSVKSEEDNRCSDNAIRHHSGSVNKNNMNMMNIPPHLAQLSPNGNQSQGSTNRTSSFAAALKKLAEQATDPITDKDLSPISAPNSPIPSSTPKRGPPSLVLISDSHPSAAVSHIPSVNFTSSPTVTMASMPHYVDGRKNADKSMVSHSKAPSNRSHFDESKKISYSSHRSHSDSTQDDKNRPGTSTVSKGGPPPLYGDRIDISSSPAKTVSSYLSSHQADLKSGSSMHYTDRSREDQNILSNRQSSSQQLQLRLLSPSWSHHIPTPTSRLDEQFQVGSSFQPYRPSSEDIRRGISPHLASTYESTSPYGYHPAAFLTPHMQQSSFRFDDPLYVERCNMFRPTLFSLPHPSVLPPHHPLPYFSGSRYTPEMIPHSLGLVSPTGLQLAAQERFKLDDPRRDHNFEIFDHDRVHSRERDRGSEFNNDSNRDQDKRQSSSWSVGSNMAAGNAGSITQGIPRVDLVSRASPNRPMMPSPSTLRLSSTGSAAELPLRQLSQNDKLSLDHIDHSVGRSIYSSNNTKALLSINNEKSPVDKDQMNMVRAQSSKDLTLYEFNDGDSSSKKVAKSSLTRARDSSSQNSFAHHPSDNYGKLNTIVPETVNANYAQESLKPNTLNVERNLSDKVKKRTVTLVHSGLIPNSDVTITKAIENESRVVTKRSLHSEELSYGDVVLSMSRDLLKLPKDDQKFPISKLYVGPTENCHQLKSKLDLAAEKAGLRFNNHDDISDDESDIGHDSNKKIFIFSGPPLELDSSKEKLHFMASVGLITQKRKRELDLDKYVRKQQRLKTFDVVLERCDDEERVPVPWFLDEAFTSTKYALEEFRKEPELSLKVNFFLNLDLNLVPIERKCDNEKILQAVVNEKILRNGFTLPSKSNIVSSSNKAPSLICDSNTTVVCENAKEAPSSDNCNREERQKNGSEMEKPNLEIISDATDSFANQYKYGREFAQEFHQSVLLQTKALSKNNRTSDEDISAGKIYSLEETSGTNVIESQVHWPGIEMLIAAYQKHLQEQKLERDVLFEQCSRLVTQNRELNNLALNLNQKTADLINVKKVLSEERCRLQQSIDNLKCFLKDLR